MTADSDGTPRIPGPAPASAGTPRAFRKGCVIAAAAGLLVGVLFVGIAIWTAASVHDDLESFDPEKQPWLSVQVPLVQGSLRFEQRSAHPLLAEYDRRIAIPGSPTEQQLALPFNPGGRTLINVYWHDAEGGHGPWVRLEETVGPFAIDLGSHPPRPWLAVLPSPHSARYLGRIDGRTARLRFIPVEEAPEEAIHMIGE